MIISLLKVEGQGLLLNCDSRIPYRGKELKISTKLYLRANLEKITKIISLPCDKCLMFKMFKTI